MFRDSDEFWVVVAPSPNFDDIPTINVSAHEVPLPAYWQISDLVAQGRPEKEIIQSVMQHTGTKAFKVIAEVVDSVAENQRLVFGRTKAPGRLGVSSETSKKVSDYRAARIEARRELQAAEEMLETAEENEEKLLSDVLLLAKQKEELKRRQTSLADRRITLSATKQQERLLLQRRQDVEAKIKYAKRLIVIYKASLA